MAATLTTLVSFSLADGTVSPGNLLIDAAGNLFGTMEYGDGDFRGGIFEIPKIGSGYANTPTMLVSFNGNDGGYPAAGLIMDSAGNLFGTTTQGGAYGDGTVFELAKAGDAYANAP